MEVVVWCLALGNAQSGVAEPLILTHQGIPLAHLRCQNAECSWEGFCWLEAGVGLSTALSPLGRSTSAAVEQEWVVTVHAPLYLKFLPLSHIPCNLVHQFCFAFLDK